MTDSNARSVEPLLRRREPLWCRVCPVCGRQLAKSTDRCCRGEFGQTVYCVTEDVHRETVNALRMYGGCRENCNALSGAPECSCGFEAAMLRALGRGGEQ